ADVTLSSKRFLAGAAALFAAAPVGRVSIYLEGERAARLAEFPALARVRELRLHEDPYDPPTADGVAEVLASPHLRGLTALTLSGVPTGPGGAAALVSSPHLGRLRRLNVSLNFGPVTTVGDAWLAALAAVPHLTGLRELALGGAGAGADGVRALARSDLLGR